MPKILNLFDENENFLARGPFSIYAEDKSSGEIPLKGVGAGLAETLVHPSFSLLGMGRRSGRRYFPSAQAGEEILLASPPKKSAPPVAKRSILAPGLG